MTMGCVLRGSNYRVHQYSWYWINEVAHKRPNMKHQLYTDVEGYVGTLWWAWNQPLNIFIVIRLLSLEYKKDVIIIGGVYRVGGHSHQSMLYNCQWLWFFYLHPFTSFPLSYWGYSHGPSHYSHDLWWPFPLHTQHATQTECKTKT